MWDATSPVHAWKCGDEVEGILTNSEAYGPSFELPGRITIEKENSRKLEQRVTDLEIGLAQLRTEIKLKDFGE